VSKGKIGRGGGERRAVVDGDGMSCLEDLGNRGRQKLREMGNKRR